MNKYFSRRSFHTVVTGLALACAAVPTWAQTFPDKPVRMVVGAPPGGAADITARLLAERMAALLGQPVLVDNKAGAAGVLGLQELIKSPKDGYTLMVNISGVMSEVPHFIKLPVDPFQALVPLAEMARAGLVFTTNMQTGAQDLNSFIAYAKANKGKINYGSYSPGTVSHTLGLELNKLAGLDMVHVGYKGSPPALQDLVGNSVQAMFDGPGNVLPFIKAGKLRPLATTAPQRLSILPDVPTFAELGYKDLTEIVSVMLFVSPEVPAPIQAKLRDAALKSLQDPKLRETYNNLGMAVGSPATSSEIIASLRASSDRQGAMLKSIGFKLE